MNENDDKLNHIIFDNKPSCSMDPQVALPSLGDTVPKAKQQSFLTQIKDEEAKHKQKDNNDQIQNMFKDIDNEFDELDSLLRDIDTLKIQAEPENYEHYEERMSNGSYEQELKAKTMAPN